MKHPYVELFTHKLNDMGLVLFEKHRDWENWEVARDSTRHFMVSDNFQYFLCLHVHTSPVLHSLNGGNVCINDGNTPVYTTAPWNTDAWYMDASVHSQIEPTKEKRWLVYNSKGVLQGEYKNLPENLDGAQCVEVEITVTE
jgi:hypothetical protein